MKIQVLNSSNGENHPFPQLHTLQMVVVVVKGPMCYFERSKTQRDQKLERSRVNFLSFIKKKPGLNHFKRTLSSRDRSSSHLEIRLYNTT